MRTRSLFITFSMIVCCITNVNARTIKILSIGNSYSQDAVENYLHEIGKAAGETIIVGNMWVGGYALEDHWRDISNDNAVYTYCKIDADGSKNIISAQKASEILIDEDWDYISFQQTSGRSGLYDTYVPYLSDILSYVKPKATNPSVKYAFYQVWAFAKYFVGGGTFANYDWDQDKMYRAILDASDKTLANHPDIEIIIPAGTAIQNGRTSFIGDNFNRDGYHLDLGVGRYTVACTWFEIFTGKSILENSYNPGITENQIKVAKQAAHNAVLSPKSITDLSDLVVIVDPNTFNLVNSVNISLGNKTESGWNIISDPSVGVSLQGLLDSEDNQTPISIEIIDDFGGRNDNGPVGVSFTSQPFVISDNISSQSFYGNGVSFLGSINATGGFKISNLNKNESFDFVIFCSNKNSTTNGETYFKVEGKTIKTGCVNSGKNYTELIAISDITPKEDGSITIEVGVGPNNNNPTKFFYLNAFAFYPSKISTSLAPHESEELKVSKVYVYNLQGVLLGVTDDLDNFLYDVKFDSPSPSDIYILRMVTNKGMETIKVYK